MQINIKLGDITKENVDAIVNAGHHLLLGGGGVDGCIHKAAGTKLVQECLQFPLKPNEFGDMIRCDVGECFVTKGYNLPCKFVIHTVAPSAKRTIKNELTDDIILDMYNCWSNVLKTAESYNFKTLSFCSLGTGGHAFPVKTASKIALLAIKSAKFTSLKEINIVCFDNYTYEMYKSAERQLNGN